MLQISTCLESKGAEQLQGLDPPYVATQPACYNVTGSFKV